MPFQQLKKPMQGFGANLNWRGLNLRRDVRWVNVAVTLRCKDGVTIFQYQITDKEILKNHTKWVYEMAQIDKFGQMGNCRGKWGVCRFMQKEVKRTVELYGQWVKLLSHEIENCFDGDAVYFYECRVCPG